MEQERKDRYILGLLDLEDIIVAEKAYLDEKEEGFKRMLEEKRNELNEEIEDLKKERDKVQKEKKRFFLELEKLHKKYSSNWEISSKIEQKVVSFLVNGQSYKLYSVNEILNKKLPFMRYFDDIRELQNLATLFVKELPLFCYLGKAEDLCFINKLFYKERKAFCKLLKVPKKPRFKVFYETAITTVWSKYK